MQTTFPKLFLFPFLIPTFASMKNGATTYLVRAPKGIDPYLSKNFCLNKRIGPFGLFLCPHFN